MNTIPREIKHLILGWVPSAFRLNSYGVCKGWCAILDEIAQANYEGYKKEKDIICITSADVHCYKLYYDRLDFKTAISNHFLLALAAASRSVGMFKAILKTQKLRDDDYKMAIPVICRLNLLKMAKLIPNQMLKLRSSLDLSNITTVGYIDLVKWFLLNGETDYYSLLYGVVKTQHLEIVNLIFHHLETGISRQAVYYMIGRASTTIMADHLIKKIDITQVCKTMVLNCCLGEACSANNTTMINHLINLGATHCAANQCGGHTFIATQN